MQTSFWFIVFSTLVIEVVSMGCVSNGTHDDFGTMTFPQEFLFAASTSAYQVEGGWNDDGKGENIWDRLSHTNSESIRDNSTGDIACDSYHKYKEDIENLSEIGLKMYRFSVSWSRILPTGDITNVNEKGIDYYNNLINELSNNGIIPMITMYHWDLPQKLQDIGGWANPYIADYMEDYADILFKQFGDRVKWWITISQPSTIVEGYRSNKRAPALDLDSPVDYFVVHNLLKAHAKVYRLYERKYRSIQKGKISISLLYDYMAPMTNSSEDQEATNREFEFNLNIFAHPIYSMEGDYPKRVKEIVDQNSEKEGRLRSRLPVFTEEEKRAVKASSDFFALNHYTTWYTTPAKSHFNYTFQRDMGIDMKYDPSWQTSQAGWQKVVPWGLRQALLRIKNTYNNPLVFITENGYCDKDVIEDFERINYHRAYLNEILKAMNDGCRVIGYTVWTLLDNFEWNSGFKNRFGLIRVDFNDPERKRTLRRSAMFFKQLINTRKIPQQKNY